jgi:hypothetical protein
MAMRSTLNSTLALAFLAIAAPLLAGCGDTRPNPTPPYIIPGGPGDTSFSRIGGDQGLAWTIGLGGGLGGGPVAPYAMPYGSGVDPFLWRGALETMSALPLASADPFAGVIITDWYSVPNAPGERLKETVSVAGHEPRSDAVRVSVSRQVDRGGRWVDAPVGSALPAAIQQRVVERARVLRQMAAAPP